jgi:hypothetical protein
MISGCTTRRQDAIYPKIRIPHSSHSCKLGWTVGWKERDLGYKKSQTWTRGSLRATNCGQHNHEDLVVIDGYALDGVYCNDFLVARGR